MRIIENKKTNNYVWDNKKCYVFSELCNRFSKAKSSRDFLLLKEKDIDLKEYEDYVILLNSERMLFNKTNNTRFLGRLVLIFDSVVEKVSFFITAGIKEYEKKYIYPIIMHINNLDIREEPMRKETKTKKIYRIETLMDLVTMFNETIEEMGIQEDIKPILPRKYFCKKALSKNIIIEVKKSVTGSSPQQRK